MSLPKELFYFFSSTYNAWIISENDEPGFVAALKGAKQIQTAKGPYLSISSQEFQNNLGFLSALGYKLHPSSSINPDGSLRNREDAPQKITSADLVVNNKPLGSKTSPYSVSQLADDFARMFEQTYGNMAVWVKGEISGWSVKQHGHCYFKLAEPGKRSTADGHTISCTLWNSDYSAIKRSFDELNLAMPKEGEIVSVLCQINFYKRSSNVSLNVKNFDATGALGEVFLQKKRIEDQLKNEGIFNNNISILHPELPLRLAIFSNETAAGFGDFFKILKSSGYAFAYKVFPVALQGKQLEPSFLHAINQLHEFGESNFDYGIIIRGGGAVNELADFNNYEVAKAVLNTPLKFIVGIGHEKDRTVMDEITYRCETPTKVAEFLIARMNDLCGTLQDLMDDLSDVCEKKLDRQKSRLDIAKAEFMRLSDARLGGLINENSRHAEMLRHTCALRLDELKRGNQQFMLSIQNATESRAQLENANLKNSRQTVLNVCEDQLKDRSFGLEKLKLSLQSVMDSRLQTLVSKLSQCQLQIEAGDPRNLLERGLAYLSFTNGKRVSSVHDLKTNDQVKAILPDGSIDLTVNAIHEDNHGKEKI